MVQPDKPKDEAAEAEAVKMSTLSYRLNYLRVERIYSDILQPSSEGEEYDSRREDGTREVFGMLRNAADNTFGESLSLSKEVEPLIIRAAADCVTVRERTDADGIVPSMKAGAPEANFVYVIDHQKVMALLANIKTIASPIASAPNSNSPSVGTIAEDVTSRAKKIIG